MAIINPMLISLLDLLLVLEIFSDELTVLISFLNSLLLLIVVLSSLLVLFIKEELEYFNKLLFESN